MTDRTSEDSFLDELEKAAKGLSVVTDRGSSEELRRLFTELHDDERRHGEAGNAQGEIEPGSGLDDRTN